LLKKETIFAYGEYRKDFNDTLRFLVEYYPNVVFTKCTLQRVANLFEDRVLFLYRKIKAHYNKLRPNVVFNFVRKNVKYLTCVLRLCEEGFFFLFSCKPDVFQGRASPYSIFIDDQFFDRNLK
jgi:hypothetical protein